MATQLRAAGRPQVEVRTAQQGRVAKRRLRNVFDRVVDAGRDQEIARPTDQVLVRRLGVVHVPQRHEFLTRRRTPNEVKRLEERDRERQDVGLDETIGGTTGLRLDVDRGDAEARVLKTSRRAAGAGE